MTGVKKLASRTRCWLLALALLFPVAAVGDAIMRSQAMFAETIVEIFIDDDALTLELEIGTDDIPVFRNLLPDPVYRDLGYGEQPLSERLQQFFEQDLMFVADGESRLVGRLSSIGPDVRPERDAITGEALPVPDEEAANVSGNPGGVLDLQV